MKNIILALLTLSLVFGFLLLPSISFAQDIGGGGGDNPPAQGDPAGDKPPTQGSESGDKLGDRANVKLENPLGKANISTIILRVLDFLTKLAAVVLTIMILIGAWQLIISGGSPEKATTAKKTILWAAVGFVIILIAQGIGAIIKSLFK
ncbi:MAG: pilin [bacterium]|nr:pilin [bacterium]